MSTRANNPVRFSRELRGWLAEVRRWGTFLLRLHERGRQRQAQRILLTAKARQVEEAVTVLTAMGFKKMRARVAVRGVLAAGDAETRDDVVKAALRRLG